MTEKLERKKLPVRVETIDEKEFERFKDLYNLYLEIIMGRNKAIKFDSSEGEKIRDEITLWVNKITEGRYLNPKNVNHVTNGYRRFLYDRDKGTGQGSDLYTELQKKEYLRHFEINTRIDVSKLGMKSLFSFFGRNKYISPDELFIIFSPHNKLLQRYLRRNFNNGSLAFCGDIPYYSQRERDSFKTHPRRTNMQKFLDGQDLYNPNIPEENEFATSQGQVVEKEIKIEVLPAYRHNPQNPLRKPLKTPTLPDFAS